MLFIVSNGTITKHQWKGTAFLYKASCFGLILLFSGNQRLFHPGTSVAASMLPMSLLSTHHYFSKISVGAWHTPRFSSNVFRCLAHATACSKKNVPYIQENICSILKEWSLDDGNQPLYETAHKCEFRCEQFFKAEHILRCFSNFPSAQSLFTCCLASLLGHKHDIPSFREIGSGNWFTNRHSIS